MSQGDVWASLGQIDAAELAEARLQAHHAVQWVARVARGYIAPKGDDSHTSLVWDGGYSALISQELSQGSRIGLRPDGLALLWLNKDEVDECALEGLDETKARSWVKMRLIEAGLDEAALEKPLPYDLPAHGVDQGGLYSAGGSPASGELAAWYASAAEALALIAEAHSSLEPGPSPVRCWPHHFDLATLISLDEGGGKEARSIGVGLSPGDEAYNEPYYYVTPWPYPEAEALPAAHRLGHWHTQEYVAAIGRAERLTQAGNTRLATLDFLQNSIGACRNLLEN